MSSFTRPPLLRCIANVNASMRSFAALTSARSSRRVGLEQSYCHSPMSGPLVPELTVGPERRHRFCPTRLLAKPLVPGEFLYPIRISLFFCRCSWHSNWICICICICIQPLGCILPLSVPSVVGCALPLVADFCSLNALFYEACPVKIFPESIADWPLHAHPADVRYAQLPRDAPLINELPVFPIGQKEVHKAPLLLLGEALRNMAPFADVDRCPNERSAHYFSPLGPRVWPWSLKSFMIPPSARM